MVHGNLKHLKKGDPQPPVQKGVLRLYGMRFCPYDHRVHLVLDIKKILHDTVFIDLSNKPDWILEKSEGGKVPSIEFDDGTVLAESLIIADYLDEAYPEPALHPKDPKAKAQDRLLLEKFGPIMGTFYKIISSEDGLNASNFETLVKALEVYEKALAKRGTDFFGGSKPSMLDLMIWPWLERIPLLSILGGDSYKLPSGRLPKLTAWSKAMLAEEAVKSNHIAPEIHAKFMAARKSGKPTYDFD